MKTERCKKPGEENSPGFFVCGTGSLSLKTGRIGALAGANQFATRMVKKKPFSGLPDPEEPFFAREMFSQFLPSVVASVAQGKAEVNGEKLSLKTKKRKRVGLYAKSGSFCIDATIFPGPLTSGTGRSKSPALCSPLCFLCPCRKAKIKIWRKAK